MHEGLTELLEKAEVVVDATGHLLGDGAVEEVARLVSGARARLDYPEDLLVVALAGGTGSGKSSLFNALSGFDSAPVGEMRPTTSRPMAALPGRHPGAMGRYLDHLGVDHRVQGTDPILCLIDLPDTDSVEVSNRHRAEAILPGIDVLVWVVDPEKYRDAALHHRYLRPLSGYASQFVFVLNQVDRLGPAAVQEVAADLVRALEEDGIPGPTVFTTSLAAGAPPRGVDELGNHLRGLAGDRHGLPGKLLADLAESAARVSAMIGRPVSYGDRVGKVLESVALVPADRSRLLSMVTGLVEDLAAETGGQVGTRLRQIAIELPRQVAGIVEAGSPEVSTGSRWRRRGRASNALPERESAVVVATRMLEPVAEIMAERARALAAVADLSLDVDRLRRVTPG